MTRTGRSISSRNDSTRSRALNSCSSSNPITDGIGTSATRATMTRRDFLRTAKTMPDQRKVSDQVR